MNAPPAPASNLATVNAMTVDVEDYFQVSAFESAVERDQWDQLPCRVEQNTRRILALFAEKDVRATFFTLGWVAERYPQLVRDIVDQGHELACHSWEHTRVTEQSREQFRADIRKTRQLLEDISGARVIGYRAPSYSIGENNLWALDELAEAGYRYSSSIVPIRHDLYGMPDAPRFAFEAAGGRLLEIPITTLNLAGRNINCGGGGWFRLFPYGFSRWALQRVNRDERQPGIFYFHPWEIDPAQPRPKGVRLKSRFRHYLNLERTEGRLIRLLEDFRWGRMDEIFLGGDPA
jgi:polysaccharide deacetylase family protein (PEP-CTERM system associated)